MSRVLGICLAFALCLLSGRAHAVPGSPVSRATQQTPIILPHSGSNDQTAIAAALVTGRPVTLIRGQTYSLTTPVTIPSNSELHLAGALINFAIPNVGQSAAFQTIVSNGTPLTLAATPTPGASTFTVTATTGLVAGGWVEISDSVTSTSQILPIAAVTGSSNPYTIYIDQGRTISWAYSTSNAPVTASTPTTGVRIYGEGATINATALVPRGIELSGCVDCLVQDLTIQGPVGWGISCDVGSYRCVQRDVRVAGSVLTVTGAADNGSGKVRLTIGGLGVPSWLVTGTQVSSQGFKGTTEANGTFAATAVDAIHIDLATVSFVHNYTSGGWITVTGVGAAFESCESCRGERLDISGVGSATGAKTGLYPYSSRGSAFDQVNVSGCWGASGVSVDSNLADTSYGSDSANFTAITAVGCTNGLQIYDAATRVRVSKSRFDASSSDGVIVSSDASTFPSGLTLDDIEVTNGGADAIHLAGGSDTALRNVRLIGNASHALEIASGATGTRWEGGRADSNGGDLVLLASDVMLANIIATNNGNGVQTTGGSTNVTASNVTQYWTTGSATAWSWYANGGGYWTLANCMTNFAGSTGNKIGLVAQTGSIVRVINFATLGATNALATNGGSPVIYYDTATLIGGVSGSVSTTGAWSKVQ